MQEEVRSKIQRGLKTFQVGKYEKSKAIYKEHATQQNPDILYIGCSDSRVSPEVILDADPGELFVLRNIANKVPSLKKNEMDPTTMSAIEFAVVVLNVKTIVICGHSNCGGCAAALSGEKTLGTLPYTKQYLEPLKELSEKITREAFDKTDTEKARMMEEQNVLKQLVHLREYSFINKRIEAGDLEIQGWRFDIGSGKVERYNEKTDSFRPII